jgi:hypothetical protein
MSVTVSSRMLRALRSPACAASISPFAPGSPSLERVTRPTRFDRLQSDQRLQATACTEVAVHELRPHAHQRDFAGLEVMAVMEFALDDDPGANAGPDGD